MSVAAFTGPARPLSPRGERIIYEVVAAQPAGTEFRTGGAVGVDTYVAFLAADLFPAARHRVIAPRAPWSNRVPDGASLEYAPYAKVRATAYMKRNELLVAGAAILYAFPATGRRIARSGTWATVRRGEAAGSLVLVTPLDGSTAYWT